MYFSSINTRFTFTAIVRYIPMYLCLRTQWKKLSIDIVSTAIIMHGHITTKIIVNDIEATRAT